MVAIALPGVKQGHQLCKPDKKIVHADLGSNSGSTIV